MKRIISLMSVLVFVFAFSACNSKNTASNTDTNTPISSETFVKPENYASVLLVSINPQFKLYLDENNNVLAVEPINEDAKSFSESIDFENKSIETVIGNIVEQANENGFIKENVNVNFEIAEQKDGINNGDILLKVVSSANQKATELNIEIKTEIKESDNSKITETNSENSKPTTTSKPAESKPAHTHEFSAATCTVPQKCSCGETKGSSLGHSWKDATCKSPKTCSVCKATEGIITEHKYENFACVYCGCKDEKGIAIATNPKLSFKPKVYRTYHLRSEIYGSSIGDNNNIISEEIWFKSEKEICLGFHDLKSADIILNEKDDFYGDDSPDINRWIIDNEAGWGCNQYYTVYNGKKYYSLGGAGDIQEGWKYELTNTEIIVSSPTEIKIKFKMNIDGSLIVSYSNQKETGDSGPTFNVGDICR